jgi:hypothetical protein
MLRRVAENCERLGLNRSVGPDAPVWVGEQGSPEIAAQKTTAELCAAGRTRASAPHVNSLIEFTIDSIEQEDARGLVKIDQIFAEDSEYRRPSCPFDPLSGW